MGKTKVALGIDIGGTNTVFGLVDINGNFHFRDQIKTESMNGAPKLFQNLFSTFNHQYKLLSKDLELIGIGIGAPNANYYKKTIENPPNLKWGFIQVDELVKSYFDLPVAITNDANAAALGEFMYGAAKGMKNFIQITLGTGLGSGVVVNGNVVYGHDGFAGEIGHTIVKDNGRLCGCGNRGCLETYASATGIRKTVFEILSRENFESELRSKSFHEISSKLIYDEACDGDEVALAAFEYTGRILGRALANSVAHLSPEAVILFGGLALAGDFIFKPTQKYMEENLFHVFRNKVKILPSALKEADAAVLGASALIWHEL